MKGTNELEYQVFKNQIKLYLADYRKAQKDHAERRISDIAYAEAARKFAELCAGFADACLFNPDYDL